MHRSLGFLLLISLAYGQWPAADPMDMDHEMPPVPHVRDISLGVLLYPGFELLDAMGPLEFWNSLSGMFNVTLAVIAPEMGPVSTKLPAYPQVVGQTLIAEYDFTNAPDLDILLIPGGWGLYSLNASASDFIRDRYPSLEYLVSVCNGAELVAQTGLLDGKNATTNKSIFKDIEARYPKVNWVTHARFVQEDNIISSSGVSAGMDMTFFLLTKIYGYDIASMIANGIEYAPHTNAEWDPFADLHFNNGNLSIAADPCDQDEAVSSTTTPTSASTATSSMPMTESKMASSGTKSSEQVEETKSSSADSLLVIGTLSFLVSSLFV